MIISIPSVDNSHLPVHFALGRVHPIQHPMLFALAFLPMFGIGGLTGLPLGFAASDCTCTTRITSSLHFHMTCGAGDDFRAVCRDLLLVSRGRCRAQDERYWGRIHFWVLVHLHERGVPARFARAWRDVRRMADGGAKLLGGQGAGRGWGLSATMMGLHSVILWARLPGAVQIPFMHHTCFGASSTANRSRTIILGIRPRWSRQTPTAAAARQLCHAAHAHRARYDYSLPRADKTRCSPPQNQPSPTPQRATWKIPYHHLSPSGTRPVQAPK